MKSILIKDTTREERIRIVHQALWGACGIDCEFCSGCDNRGGGRIEGIYQPYIDALGKCGVPAEETVFIDDSVRNLQGAAELGILPVLIAARPEADVETEYLKTHDLRELIR
jgi:methionine salvage enolase-phosphatase E1